MAGPAAQAYAAPPEAPASSPAAEPFGEVNIKPPVIEGDPVVGGTLTSTGGQWANAAWIQYRWTAGNDTILLETSPVGTPSTVRVENGLAGATISLTVVASAEPNGGGTEMAAPQVTVRNGTFQNVAWTGSVAGTPRVGQLLSVTAPVWKGPFGMSADIGYQWYRSGTAIAGATGQKYTATAADSSRLLGAKATLRLSGFTPLALASKQVTVAAGTFTAAPTPNVVGAARVGQVQTANAGNWAPAAAALSYQWYRGSGVIGGATGRTYTTTAADSGKAVKVRIRATKAGYVTVDKYSAARTIGAGVFTATKSVTVTGAYRFGQTLRISQGWSPAPASTKYQWYRNGSAIKGGTLPYLYLNSGYIGAKVTVKITLSRAGFLSRSTSTAGTFVRNAATATLSVPKISGTLKAGSVLTASNGTYSPAPTAVRFQWFRNGAAIAGAKNRTYKLTSADNGKSITVRASTYRQFHDSKVVASAAAAIAMPPVTVISRDGTYRIGTSLKPGLYKATGSGNGCYWERLSGFSGSLSQIKANHFGAARTYVQILAGDVGFSTSGCGAWTTVAATGAKAVRIGADGTYRVGIDILPGTYFGSGAGSSCYWETVSGFSGDFGAVMDNYFGSAWTIIDVPASAKGFTASGCGTLLRR